ncbi:hypothetical protein ACKWTF_011384 [Chironomus riparius]
MSVRRLLRIKRKLATYKDHFNCNLQECDCLFEKNDFEKSILAINRNKAALKDVTLDVSHCGDLTFQKLNDAKEIGPKLTQFNKRLEMIRTTYEDTLGKNAGNCVYNQRHLFDKILNIWLPPKSYKKIEPLVLIDKGDPCDFSSHKEKIVIPKTVKQEYRAERTRRFFTQSYMQAAWEDFIFINDLKTNKVLKKSTQNAERHENIHNVIDECIEKNWKIIKQLHARCPLYMKRNNVRSEKWDKTSKFRMQYKIRREMFTALEDIQACYVEKRLEDLIKIAEGELGVRYRIHPSYLMPRRNEFIVEICNYIALAHFDDIIKSSTLVNSHDYEDYDLLKKLLGIHYETKSIFKPYVFGDQSTYRDPAEPNTSYMTFRNKIVRLERRLSQKPMLKIEQCHLLYEMARANLEQLRPDEAREIGEKMVEEADSISYLWLFLGKLTICRADILQKQFKDAGKGMNDVVSMVDIFKSQKLKMVIEHAFEIVKRLS